MCHVLFNTQSTQHVRWLKAGTCAGTATAHSQILRHSTTTSKPMLPQEPHLTLQASFATAQSNPYEYRAPGSACISYSFTQAKEASKSFAAAGKRTVAAMKRGDWAMQNNTHAINALLIRQAWPVPAWDLGDVAWTSELHSGMSKGKQVYLETHDQGFTLHVGEGQVHVAHISLLCVLWPIQDNTVTLGLDALMQALCQGSDVLCVSSHVQLGNLTGLAQPYCQ